MTAATFSAPTDSPSSSRLATQLAEDKEHSPEELVEILTHCSAVTACADYRMLQAIGMIYTDLDEGYNAMVDEALDCGRVDSIEELAARAITGAEIRARFGPDGMEQAIALVGATLTVTAARARSLIIAGTTMHTQLPYTGSTLACGRIDLTRFLMIVDRTMLCDPKVFDEIDADLAVEISNREPMSLKRFRTMVDMVIARIDPEAARRHRERGDARRNISIRPDRSLPGQSRVTGWLPAAPAASLNARLDAMAAGVHPGDGRTRAQRRADALIALGEGEQHLACRCPDCVAPAYDAPSPDMQSAGAHSAGTITPSDPAAQPHSLPADAITPPTGAQPSAPLPATSSGPAASPHPTACTHPIASPRPTFHIVVSLETLLGADNAPAFLDGHGIIDATVARQLVAEAKRSYVHTKHSPSERHSPPVHSESSEGTVPSPSPGVYAPSGSIRALVTAGELCCTFPGCSVSVRRCDLDHTIPHAAGGATDVANLKPLCRLHHRVKTFVKGWRDYQDPLGRVFFTSPTGHTFLGNAFTGRDVFRELAPARRVVPNRAGARIIELRHDRATAHRRARARREAADPPPF